MPSPSVEQYLQSIYRLGGGDGVVRLKAVADDLAVSPASVTEMARRLSEMKMCGYRPYQGVSLTTEGRDIALRVLRKHRLWERFLVDVLRMPWDTAHAEAHRLEHSTSDYVAERLSDILNHPSTCPHGFPVPGPDGRVDSTPGMALSEVKPGETVRVVRVARETPHFLTYLRSLGLLPGATLTVRRVEPVDGVVRATVDGKDVSFGLSLARSMIVSLMDGSAAGNDT